jgi:hypothetical protein
MVLKAWIRAGVRMLIAGTALQGLSLSISADDVRSADFQTRNVSQSKQVSPISLQTGEGCGVAKVPGCTTGSCANGACANGGMKCGAAGCGPQGCVPGSGWGPCGCPSCQATLRNGQPTQGVDLFSFRDVGDAMRRHQPNWSMLHADWGPQTDWNDEMGNAPCPEHGRMHCPHCCGWWNDQWALFNARNREQGAILRAHIHGKLAYFHPMGNGGEGVPPFGCYHLVYAANPSYVDPRDSQLYAAQGWGVPISVPLAPTVRHTMNYSTGIPSSRLTPISNVVPPRGGRCW